jgi:lipid A ethanolaminephosphotransferase
MIKRNTVSSGTLILATAVFVAVFCNIAFFRNAVQVYGVSLPSILFMASLFVYITSIFIFVLSAVCHRTLTKPVLTLFLLLASVVAYFSTNYGTIFDGSMIANVFETDTGEAGDLLTPQLAIYVILLGILPSLAIWRATIAQQDWKTETKARLKLVAITAAALAVTFLPFSANYASMLREHREIASKINPTFALYSTFKLAMRSLPQSHTQHIAIGTDAEIPSTDVHRELVVMVVGETARADHWSMNGYPRETTPLLKQEGVTNFPDFWSCDTSTAKSVPCMFSNLGRAGFNVRKAQNSDNALDVLARAGVSVLWRDNNSSSKGVADRVPYEDFKSSKKNPVCTDIECRDEGMLDGLQKYIDAQTGDILIVLHQMGNHGPAYYKRYPAAFERFTPVCQTNDLGSCTHDEIINAYDNAILYTDYFLSRVISLLKSNDDKFETAMVYVSDHGESLGEYGLYLHATPYMLAPDAQRHVPAVIWLGNNMKKNDVRVETLEQRSKRRWSHDNIFATLLGLFEINSTVYDAHMDLLEHRPEDQTHAAAPRQVKPDPAPAPPLARS